MSNLWSAVPLRETILAVITTMPSEAAPEHVAAQVESQVRGWLDRHVVEPTYEYRAVRVDPYRKTSWWPTRDDASARAKAAGWRDWKFERRVVAGKPERVQ